MTIDADKLVESLNVRILRNVAKKSSDDLIDALIEIRDAVVESLQNKPAESAPPETPVELPHGFPRTVEDAVKQCAVVGATKEEIEAVWNKAVSRGGLDAKGMQIKSWPHYVAMNKGYNQSRKAEQKATVGFKEGETVNVPMTPWNLKAMIEAIEIAMNKLKDKHRFEAAGGTIRWDSEDKRQEFIKLRTKRDELQARLTTL